MKNIVLLFSIFFSMFMACNSYKTANTFEDKPKLESDTIHIANEALEYDVIIIDGGFTSWFNMNAKPRNYYTQSYLETRNRFWITEWNRRVLFPSQYNPNLYEMAINYNSSTDYGHEVNYMIYNYLVYFQLTNKQQLGGFVPRI